MKQVLEKIKEVRLNSHLIDIEYAISVFSKKKKQMIFILDNGISINQGVFEDLKICRENKLQDLVGKIESIEQIKDSNDYYLGFYLRNESDLNLCNFKERLDVLSTLFLKKMLNYEYLVPDRNSIIFNKKEVLLVPFKNEDEEIVYYSSMDKKDSIKWLK